jgi:DNA polymerase I-like protein with 3'-5' exonuclease and polymerase domains
MAKSVEPERPESTVASEYLVHETNGAIEEATARLGGLGLAFILTTEPGGPGGALTGISISSEPGRGEHLAIDRCEDRAAALKRVAGLLENEHIEKATHDGSARSISLKMRGSICENVVDDTLLEGYLLSADAKDYDLPLLATTFLNENSSHLPPPWRMPRASPHASPI